MPEVVKNIFYVIYIIVCVVLILITTLQPSEGRHSAEDTYDNTKYNKNFEKNKGRTKAGKLQRRTIWTGIIFTVLTLVVSIICLF